MENKKIGKFEFSSIVGHITLSVAIRDVPLNELTSLIVNSINEVERRAIVENDDMAITFYNELFVKVRGIMQPRIQGPKPEEPFRD